MSLPVRSLRVSTNTSCVLDGDSSAYNSWIVFADAHREYASTNYSCSEACPRYTPFCENATCIRPTCAHVSDFCSLPTVVGQRARQFCPVTCGCASPVSKLLLTSPQFGCGDCAQTLSYKGTEKRMKCRNTGTVGVQKFAEGLRGISQGWPGSAFTTANALISILENDGCDSPEFSIDSLYCLDAGPHGLPIKPLTQVCPISCGCKMTDLHPTCPSTCL